MDLLTSGYYQGTQAMRRLLDMPLQWWLRLQQEDRGEVVVEYLLLLTIVGLGVIVGLAALKSSLLNELNDLSNAIKAIT